MGNFFLDIQYMNKIWPDGNLLRSTHCREVSYLKLCTPSYIVITTQILIISIDYNNCNNKARFQKKLGYNLGPQLDFTPCVPTYF